MVCKPCCFVLQYCKISLKENEVKRNFDCKYVAKIAGVTVVSSASSYVVLALLAIPHRYLSQNSANIVNNYAVPALLSIPPKYLSQNFINMMNNYAGSRIVTDKIMGVF